MSNLPETTFWNFSKAIKHLAAVYMQRGQYSYRIQESDLKWIREVSCHDANLSDVQSHFTAEISKAFSRRRMVARFYNPEFEKDLLPLEKKI